VSTAEARKVTVIQWSSQGEKPTKSYADYVESLKGKLLTAEDIVGLITNFVADPGKTVSGLKFRAAKEDDLTGVCLTFALLQGLPRTNEWGCADRVQLGWETTDRSGWGVGPSPPFYSMPPSNFIGAIQKAIAGPPETSFEINLDIQ
jgi:hypothetical protein